MNVKQALANGSQLLRDFKLESAELDAELLLSHAVSKSREQLYSHDDIPLTSQQRKSYRRLLERRASGEPVAYLLGKREFMDLPLEVNRHVLIPRPETETLVERVLEWIQVAPMRKPRIVDVGTGSGAIALSLAKHAQKARIIAVDISRQALDQASKNARELRLHKRVQFKRSDLLSHVQGPFDCIVANLPYLTNEQLRSIPADVRDFEPHHALAGGPDGLYWYEKLLTQAKSILAPGGTMFIEIGPNLRLGTERLVKNVFPSSSTLRFHRDLAGRVRIAEIQLGQKE